MIFNLTYKDVVKQTISGIVGIGINKIVSDIVSNNVSSSNKIQSVCVYAGKLALSSMIGDISAKRTDDKIDKLYEWWDTNVTVTDEKDEDVDVGRGASE